MGMPSFARRASLATAAAPLAQELYDVFVEEQRRLGETAPSYTYFTRTWSEERGHIKPKTGGEFMKCHACTMYKETRFGAPGIRPSTNPATLAAAKKSHEEHLKV